jgi:nucleoside-diphosphate-sugar epimerase
MAFVPGRILLTGASGFVGRHLTACLAAAYPDATLMTPASMSATRRPLPLLSKKLRPKSASIWPQYRPLRMRSEMRTGPGR